MRGDVLSNELIYTYSRVNLTSDIAKPAIEKFIKEVKEIQQAITAAAVQ